MDYIEDSEALTGYRVKLRRRDAFSVAGYTLIVPPHQDGAVPRFWSEVRADGRYEALQAASAVPTCVLGLGSWDPECEQGGQRYTICIEQTEQTDFSALAAEEGIFTKDIGASDWLCFETTFGNYMTRFWQDNPYEMMTWLGYRFHTRDFSVGLHFEAYTPDCAFSPEAPIEFWITVVKE
jgi:predicted transcriptional regulator YdeE